MKCWIHKGGCAVVRKRTRVSEDMMLRWLFKGKRVPAGASKTEKAALVKEHRAAWQAVLNEAVA